ncbi:RNA polymerase sigma factor SigJ [Phenylobacterium soli]|uniref:RNA polymerase sigma factor SigJ n=1 Tax=Phenylobacterium soli TaxID=2170551 RepID=A0A328A9K7_9CAUL|nr:RNA polymerase sigma factor SigJ [Phenylobacterium soli]RAK51219.1 RNA polymerase sigma factor SigJ [Phenylobacterium soli]
MDRTAAFEGQRPRLKRLAYRMLGSVAEADDVVQDAWIRWTRAPDDVADPAAWLVRAATRLSIDRLRAAKAERAHYRGPWLPEPMVEPLTNDPVERAEDVSVAFLLALERLSPLERAVFLLHDVFDEDYGAVAKTLGRSEAAVRQLASRAREHVRDARPRFSVSQDRALALAAAFMEASSRADLTGLSELLAEDAVLVSDGGGKRKAALRVLVGREDVLSLFRGLRWRGGALNPRSLELAWINGAPGVVMQLEDGPATVAVEPDAEGRVAAVYMVRNPDKLAHLADALTASPAT